MLTRRCPFLGLCKDPDTVAGFASLRNCCHRVENPHPVRLDHQRSHCFTFEHRHCPVLTAEAMTDLPAGIIARDIRKRAALIVSGLISLLGIITLLIIFFGGWQPAGAIDQPAAASLTPAGTRVPAAGHPGAENSATPTAIPPAPSPTAIPAATEGTAVPAVSPHAPTNTASPIPTECGAPSGWGIYIVQAGDTLYSIARAQGVSVAALQAANCLTSTVIRVGQQIYVPNPNSPTNTPLAQPTDTPTSTTPPSATPSPSPTATPIPPTDTPSPSSTPTDTPLPPTNTPAPTDTPAIIPPFHETDTP